MRKLKTPPVVTIDPAATNSLETPIQPPALTREQRRQAALDKAAISDELLFTRAREGMDAIIVTRELINGEMVETEKPDMVIRHKYWQDMMKATGFIKPDETTVSVAVVDKETSLAILASVRQAAKRTVL